MSKYLFLSNAQRDTSSTNCLWTNLPTLSNSTRECYLRLNDIKVDFHSSSSAHGQGLIIYLEVPVSNYYSSDNKNSVIGFLDETTNGNEYTYSKENPIELLTNDNLKSVKIILKTLEGVDIDIAELDTINLVLKLDYVDQKEQVQQFIKEEPKRL